MDVIVVSQRERLLNGLHLETESAPVRSRKTYDNDGVQAGFGLRKDGQLHEQRDFEEE